MKAIVGMHRSGTSLVALLLLRGGADFGDPAGFYPPDRWNPDGYHEQVEILRLNRLLLNGALGYFGNLTIPTPRALERRARKLASELATAAAKFNPVFVKDPRFNITAPAWEAHGTCFEKFIVCLREPIEVAESLKRRNGLPIIWGLRLWRLYFERLLENTKGRSCWIVDYTQLISAAGCQREIAGLLLFANISSSASAQTKLAEDVIRLRTAPPPAQPRYSAAINTILARLRQQHQRQQGLTNLQG